MELLFIWKNENPATIPFSSVLLFFFPYSDKVSGIIQVEDWMKVKYMSFQQYLIVISDKINVVLFSKGMLYIQ